jgi:hypothetical protein
MAKGVFALVWPLCLAVSREGSLGPVSRANLLDRTVYADLFTRGRDEARA